MDADIDRQRALQALRRGWVRREQLEACLAERKTAGSLVAELQRRGWLDADQVRQLHEGAVSVNRDPPDPRDAREVLAEGDVIAGRYRIERLLKGGCGRVYLCVQYVCSDGVSGRRVALKTLLREHLATDGLLEMFRREVLTWIQLGGHPNIVVAYGLEEFLRLPFVVMECVEGGSLGDVLRRGGAGWRAAADYGRQVARGLEHAGRVCGLVHRDLKPPNVLVTPDGTAKVADFGLALVRGASENAVVGTPPYMPPEQWERPRDVDVRSDIYAFGVMLFELACGRRPFPDHAQVSEYRADHLGRPPPDPRTLSPDVPEPLAGLILRCLAKEQARRPPDFSALLSELEPFAGPRAAALPTGPHVVDGLVNQSRTYVLLGRLDEADRAAREAVRLAPGHSNAHAALGNALGDQGRHGEALRELAEAHRLDPQNPVPIVNSAHYAFLAGDRAAAAEWLDRAIASVEPPQLEGISHLLIELGRLEEAGALCQEIVARNPMAVMAWNNLAIVRRRLGDLDGALECATRAVKLNPRYAKGWSNRATVLVQLRRFEEAVGAADTALECDPRTAGAYAAKAAALRELGHHEAARACLQEGLGLLPNHPLLLRALQSL